MVAKVAAGDPIGGQHAHQHRVFVGAVSKEGLPANALLDESQFFIAAARARIVGKDLQLDAVQPEFAKAVVQDQSGGLGPKPLSPQLRLANVDAKAARAMLGGDAVEAGSAHDFPRRLAIADRMQAVDHEDFVRLARKGAFEPALLGRQRHHGGGSDAPVDRRVAHPLRDLPKVFFFDRPNPNVFADFHAAHDTSGGGHLRRWCDIARKESGAGVTRSF